MEHWQKILWLFHLDEPWLLAVKTGTFLGMFMAAIVSPIASDLAVRKNLLRATLLIPFIFATLIAGFATALFYGFGHTCVVCFLGSDQPTEAAPDEED